METIDRRLARELTMETVPPAYQGLAEALGIGTLLKLVDYTGGSHLYIPKLSSLVKTIKENRVKAEYNGYNVVELASRYDMSEAWVRYTVGPEQLEGQQSLFQG